jgi:hypothetical protein
MKNFLFILLFLPLVAFSQKPATSNKKQVTSDTVKVDSLVTYTPTDFQMQVIQEYQKQIDELTKKEMEFILFGFGVAINPKTLVFDGKQFKAKKQ